MDRRDIDQPRSDAFREPVAREDPSRWHTGTDPRDIDREHTLRDHDDAHLHDRDARAAPIYRERVMAEGGRREVIEREPPVAERRFSLGATFLGWSVASFFTFVFLAVVAAIIGGTAFTGGTDVVDNQAVEQFAVGGFIGYLVAVFLAYVIGGYAAGRIALWDGVKHGMLTVAWAVLFAVIGLVAGVYFADALIVTTGFAFDVENITTLGVVAALVSLVVMLAGAGLGGNIGERYHARVHGEEPRRRRTVRGRPL